MKIAEWSAYVSSMVFFGGIVGLIAALGVYGIMHPDPYGNRPRPISEDENGVCYFIPHVGLGGEVQCVPRRRAR